MALSRARALTRRAVAAALAGGLCLGGCGGQAVSIPRPSDQLAPPPPAPAIEPSVLAFAVDLGLTRLLEAAEEAIPRELGSETEWLEVGPRIGGRALLLQYRLWRDELRVEMAGDRLVTQVAMQYGVRARLDGVPGSIETPCGYDPQTARRLRFTAASTLAWTTGWGLRSMTTFAPPDLGGACSALASGLDVSAPLRALLVPILERLARSLDERVARGAARPERVELIWNELARPVELGPGIWLALRPRTAHAGPITGGGPGIVRTTVSLTAEPIVAVGAPPAESPDPVSALQLVAEPAPAFNVALPLRIPYPELNRRLLAGVVGTDVDIGARAPLRINDAHLYGSGARLIVQLAVTGAVDGTIYLAGTPVVEAATQTLRLDDLDLTTDSAGALVSVLGRLFYTRIVAALESRTRLPLAQHVETLRQRLTAAVNRELVPGVQLGGAVDRFDVRGVYPIPDGVEIQVVFGGTLHLTTR